MKNYTIKAENENNKDLKGSTEDNSSKCKMCNGHHDLDVCKAFNYITVEKEAIFVQAETMLWLL